MCTGVAKVFSPFGVVASAFETASTLVGSAEASFGGSFGLFGGGGSLPDGFDAVVRVSVGGHEGQVVVVYLESRMCACIVEEVATTTSLQAASSRRSRDVS
jgi:hypothetical protein